MIGIRGCVGDGDASFDPEWVTDAHEVTCYVDGDIQITTDFHTVVDEPQPAQSSNSETLFWVWGEIYGYQRGTTYIPRHSMNEAYTDAEYCAHLYDECGLKFVSGLNSEFAGVIYDRSAEVVHLYTDRLGSRPIYYSHDGESLYFATNLVDLYSCDGLELSLSAPKVCEYLNYERVLGTETPFTELRMVPPGTRLTFDIEANQLETTTYWKPTYDPVDRPFKAVVDDFQRAFETAMAERTQDTLQKGLLLSGGSDSRIIVSSTDDLERAYHLNERRNAEFEVSNLVANEAGIDFTYLRRDESYYETVLREYGPFINFSGWFDQAHVAGFGSTLVEDIDVVFTGHYADTIFGHYIPKVNLSVPFIGPDAELPIQSRVSDIEEYCTLFENGHGHLTRGGDQFQSSGCVTLQSPLPKRSEEECTFGNIPFQTITDLLVAGIIYPITNTKSYPFYESLLQFRPVRMPFLDNRVVDVALRTPLHQLLRKDLTQSTLINQSDELAKIPHAESGLPLTYPSVAHSLGVKWARLKRELGESNINAGPWPDHDQLIRETGFIGDFLSDNAEAIFNMGIFDEESVWECYDEHLQGTDRTSELYAIASFGAIQSEFQFEYGDEQ